MPEYPTGGPPHTITRALVLAAVVVLVVAASVTTAVLVTANRVTQIGVPIPGNGTNEPLRLPDAPARVVAADATRTSGPGIDSAGTPFTYEAANAIDSRADTAWRCDGDAIGVRLTLTFAAPATISWIGMIPGFAKIDPYDGTDRYLQGRRVSTARFVFDDGTFIEHTFDTWSSSRTLQVVRFVPTTTGHVTVIVVSSVPGSATNGFGPTDKTAISELTVG